LETVKCDLCNSEKYDILFQQTDLLHKTTTEKFQMVKCENCRLHYINPRPTKHEIGKYYSNKYDFHVEKRKLKIILREFMQSLIQIAYFDEQPTVKKILFQILLLPLYYLPKLNKHLPYILTPKIKSYIKTTHPQRILDIGCGSGETIHLYPSKETITGLLKKGWEVYGVEVSDKAREILNKRGIENTFSDLFQEEFSDNYFDIIRMNWSLEHVHHPTSYLSECKRILKEDGKLIISIPNYNGITYKIFPQCVEFPIHLYYFDTITFKKYCKKLEFKIIDYYTFSYIPLLLESIRLMQPSVVG